MKSARKYDVLLEEFGTEIAHGADELNLVKRDNENTGCNFN